MTNGKKCISIFELAIIIDILIMKGVIKRFVEHIWFNTNFFTFLESGLFNEIPPYVIILAIILSFIIVIGIIIITLYYIKRKFDSIDKHTDKSLLNNNKNCSDTYKETKEEYKKIVSDLDAKILPDMQVTTKIVKKFIEFISQKRN